MIFVSVFERVIIICHKNFVGHQNSKLKNIFKFDDSGINGKDRNAWLADFSNRNIGPKPSINKISV